MGPVGSGRDVGDVGIDLEPVHSGACLSPTGAGFPLGFRGWDWPGWVQGRLGQRPTQTCGRHTHRREG